MDLLFIVIFLYVIRNFIDDVANSLRGRPHTRRLTSHLIERATSGVGGRYGWWAYLRDLSYDAAEDARHRRELRRADRVELEAIPVQPTVGPVADPQPSPTVGLCPRCGTQMPFHEVEQGLTCEWCRYAASVTPEPIPTPDNVIPFPKLHPDADPAPGASEPNPKENTVSDAANPETTGLISSIAYAEQTSAAYTRRSAQHEAYLAALVAGEVRDPLLGRIRSAQDEESALAGTWNKIAEELRGHLAVKEAYEANRSAGSREHILSE